jgi:hypothetical protein
MTVKLPAIDNLDAANKKLFMQRKALIDSTIQSLRNDSTQIVRLDVEDKTNK